MKKLEIVNDLRIKKQLLELNASKTEIIIVENNVYIYNHLVKEIIAGKLNDFRTINLIFQMNSQIMKQLEMLSKRAERKQKAIDLVKAKAEKIKPVEPLEVENKFKNFENSMKLKKIITPA